MRKASSGRRGPLALIPIALLLLAAAAAAAVLVSSGGDDSGGDPSTPSQQAGDAPARGQAKQGKADKAKPAKPEKAKSKGQAETTPAEPAAQPEPPATTPIDPARGAQLNGQGYALMQRGDYSGAIPVLQQAVASWPDDSTALEYAYALFNLGKSLNRAGRPSEAIPLLEKRLAWDDQRATVEAELALARRNAAGG